LSQEDYLTTGWPTPIFWLNQALKFLKDKEGTIYTDSQCTFGGVHTFGKIWAERGLINSRVQDLIYKELLLNC
jgi:hypothetical protein